MHLSRSGTGKSNQRCAHIKLDAETIQYSMFAVCCPASVLWHPSVHHSLLLLRALQQPHTLLLDSFKNVPGRLVAPLLFESAMCLTIQCPASRTAESATPPSEAANAAVTLYRPEDVLWFLQSQWTMRLTTDDTEAPVLSVALQRKVQKEWMMYLEAAAVSSHVISAADALLVAMQSAEMETVRQTHSRLMHLVERLDQSLVDTRGEACGTDARGELEVVEEPLSTWPLFTTLQFLIEQGGLLTSPFPRVREAYDRLQSRNKAVHFHGCLVQKTVEQQLTQTNEANSSSSGVETYGMAKYPQEGFLRDVQRHLADYNRSIAETVNSGVVGDKGPLNSRVNGGRLGMQAVPARLPWTLQSKPLRKA